MLKRSRSSLILSGLLLWSSLRATTFDLSTATVEDINAAFAAGALTSEKLVTLYLARIAAYDQKGPSLNTIITLNPNALETARALDAERKAKGPRSPLHGIPILPKDVYDTYDLPTSGGFKWMANSRPSRDSFVINRLRQAGAIILGKLNQSDWYGVASGSKGGGTLMTRVLSPYNQQKSVGGSSSGTGAAMAAWFATVGLGSDTEGSIVVPSTLNNLVGFSTTHGLVSRTGMMWSSPAQESGGPMGRSVYDCAAVLSIIAGYDPADLPTQDSIGKIPDLPYTAFVAKDGLKGARVGVLREMFHAPGPLHAEGLALMETALSDLKKAGAVVIDPVLTGLDLFKLLPDADTADYERAAAIDKYLSGLPPDAPIRSVDEMIAKGGDAVKPEIIATAKLRGTLDHNPGLASVYKQEAVLRQVIAQLMDNDQLDVIVLPYRTALPDDIAHPMPGNWKNVEVRNHIASSTGFPTMIVPGGFFPSDGMPFGVQFLGRPFSEPTMIKIASGYEAATHHRKPAPLTPALPGERFEY